MKGQHFGVVEPCKKKKSSSVYWKYVQSVKGCKEWHKRQGHNLGGLLWIHVEKIHNMFQEEYKIWVKFRCQLGTENKIYIYAVILQKIYFLLSLFKSSISKPK